MTTEQQQNGEFLMSKDPTKPTAWRYENKNVKGNWYITWTEPPDGFNKRPLYDDSALQAAIAEYKQDAERYRWLREQNATLDDKTFYVGIDDREAPEEIMWVGSDLDAAIDRARGEVK